MNDDTLYFRQRPKRETRIRSPAPGEFEHAWRMLGMHNDDRRRVLVWRVPKNNPGRNTVPDGLMRIPFLANADETIEDDDRVLLPIMDDLMRAALDTQPTNGFAITGQAGAFPGWSA
jgi:hypothetical protein